MSLFVLCRRTEWLICYNRVSRSAPVYASKQTDRPTDRIPPKDNVFRFGNIPSLHYEHCNLCRNVQTAWARCCVSTAYPYANASGSVPMQRWQRPIVLIIWGLSLLKRVFFALFCLFCFCMPSFTWTKPSLVENIMQMEWYSMRLPKDYLHESKKTTCGHKMWNPVKYHKTSAWATGDSHWGMTRLIWSDVATARTRLCMRRAVHSNIIGNCTK